MFFIIIIIVKLASKLIEIVYRLEIIHLENYYYIFRLTHVII